VVKGHKTIETRSWNTHYRGPMLIHASKGKAGEIVAALPAFKNLVKDFDELPFGAIIGEVILTEVIRLPAHNIADELMNQFTLEEKAFGDYTHGRYAWMLEGAIEYDVPVKSKGSLHLWNYYV
jgi:hypothetical protein